MKSLILICLLLAPSFGWSKTLYRVDIREDFTSGICYANPLQMDSFASAERCSEVKGQLESEMSESATISNPDRPPQSEITQWHHDGEAAKYGYFCFSGDEDFNRRLGRRLCEQKSTESDEALQFNRR